jgi:hypothetical protein
MRLQDSIGFSKAALPCPETVKSHIPETVTTLHWLLGAMPPSPYFRHDAATPLVYDLVVVDEARRLGWSDSGNPEIFRKCWVYKPGLRYYRSFIEHRNFDLVETG